MTHTGNVQTVLLKRSHFTQQSARAWIKAHNYHLSMPDTTAQYFRFRQFPPSPSGMGRERMVPLGDIGYLGILYPK
jgi:hypothetical protein